ncbi:hypothetical protein A500_05301 [Clostridium sartagoforme AAU1]|uniref:Uncharacterized protein n=1 Tax=Clostridium sartagoforme AAU1 TaxID=1202534 RepID=R9CE84_9CLOT|nr:hypothetical protein A500_05301 [Clostridium sartagoforme AAU1]
MKIFPLIMKIGEYMIKVENLSKEFKSSKKYPGFKGAIKSFFLGSMLLKKLLMILVLK